MTYIEAIILGFVQGLTEFFPVSSSGHLQLVQSLLGLSHLDHYLLFDLICHLGTLLALLFGFYSEISKSLWDRQKVYQVILGTLPLFPLALILKPLKALLGGPELLGVFFLTTSVILYAGIRLGKPVPSPVVQENRWRDALLIGLSQAVAILPGISRSGATISMGRLLGWPVQDAVIFSFLLAIPAVLGGVTLESWTFFRTVQHNNSLDLLHYSLGFVVSFIVGLFAVQLLKYLMVKDKFLFFVWYCMVVGIFSFIYFK